MASSGGISHSGAISISNIASLISIKLDRDNYLVWKSQFLPILHTNKLLKYVDGSAPCPPQFLYVDGNKPTTNLNPEYELWIEQDSLVLLWINATLTPQVLQRVVGLEGDCLSLIILIK